MTADLVPARRPATEAGATAALLVGGLLALWGVAADLVGSAENPLVEVVLLAGQVPAPWAAAGFAVGVVAARAGAGPVAAAAWAVLALVLADVLYYAGQIATGARSSQDAVVSAAATWGLIAVGAGVVLGTAGAVFARGAPHDVAAGSVAAGGVAAGLLGAIFLAEAVAMVASPVALVPLMYAAVDLVLVAGLGSFVARAARPAYCVTVVVLGSIGALVAGPVYAAVLGLIG